MKLKNRMFLTFLLSALVPAGLLLGAVAGMIPAGIDLFLLLLSLASLILSDRLYREIAEPVFQLKNAVRNIRDGNLDFELKSDASIVEIRDLCEAFDEMRRNLREANEEKVAFDEQNRELISNISHDLKTPITAVKGYALGLMEGVADTPEKQERYLRTIYNKTNEMDHLINELSFYSKISTNRIPYAFDRVNVRGFFDGASEDIRDDLQSEGFEFTYTNAVPEDVQVIADVEQITRVLGNLVGNAVKYNDKAEKRVGLSVSMQADEVVVCVSDNGRGIAAKDLANVFERFYRTDESRHSSAGGSGIGLSIVKKIIEDHGGRVWASSRTGEGTRMYFALRRYVDGSAGK